jgi:hypothetical protein
MGEEIEMGSMKIAGKVAFSIGAPWVRGDGRSATERNVMSRKHSERIGVAAVIASMRSSVAAFVSSAGFDCNHDAHIVVAVPTDWSDKQLKAVGHELTKLVYVEYGVDEEAERASRLAAEESDQLWSMKWIESNR